jgi:hypothetical protein
MALPRLRYGNEADRLRAMDQLLSRVRLLPGVQYAGITDFRPLGSTMNTLIRKRSNPNVLGVTAETIAGDYFAAMGTRVIRGRPFTVRDDATAPYVALINEAASRRYWPGEDSLGKEILTGEGKRQKSRRIIGIVAVSTSAP